MVRSLTDVQASLIPEVSMKSAATVSHSHPDWAPSATGHCKMQMKMAHIVFSQVCVLVLGVSVARSFFINDSGKITFIY